MSALAMSAVTRLAPCVMLVALAPPAQAQQEPPALPAAPAGPAPEQAYPLGMRCLRDAYPEHICGLEPNTLVWCDGERMVYDDGVQRDSFEAKLASASLKDQLSIPYTLGAAYPIPGVNHDPGRLRHEPFFRKMYGGDARAVQAKTRLVAWMPDEGGKKLRVTRVNQVDERLARVSAALMRLDSPTRKIVASTSGAFVWRRIGDTTRQSMHSFGVAVDVGVPHSDFWGWVKREPDGTLKYRNRFPLSVVQRFEEHGFIWGGKWYHFDTMHFEYRPELICMARALVAAKERP